MSASQRPERAGPSKVLAFPGGSAPAATDRGETPLEEFVDQFLTDPAPSAQHNDPLIFEQSILPCSQDCSREQVLIHIKENLKALRQLGQRAHYYLSELDQRPRR